MVEISREHGNENDLVKLLKTLGSALLKVPFATGRELTTIDEVARRMFFMIEGSTGFIAAAYAVSHGFRGALIYTLIPFADFLIRAEEEFRKKGLHAGRIFEYNEPGIVGIVREELTYIITGNY